jgi:SAM-dependent methyltransferase
MTPGSLARTLRQVADAIFNDRRLAEIYDPLEPDRSDLEPYLAMVDEFGAQRVLDIGCGTGTFACLLAARGVEVVAIDPAAASLEVARRKPGVDVVRWMHGEAASLPPLDVDLVTMTGNVAQVFVADEDWAASLRAIHGSLRPGGRLVFETRDPAREGWLEWNREDSFSRTDIDGVGVVESWVDLLSATGGIVSFRWTFQFASDGAVLTSDSTLRFRGRDEVAESLARAGFALDEVRDAPDRPGREFVFVATRMTDAVSTANAADSFKRGEKSGVVVRRALGTLERRYGLGRFGRAHLRRLAPIPCLQPCKKQQLV